MTAPTLPWMPGAVRSLLLADAAFSAACGGWCTPSAPTRITGPFAQVRIAGNYAVDARNSVYRPLIQIDGWAPEDLAGEDPTLATWQIAAEAARILAGARNVAWQSVHYTARVVDGPMVGEPDTSRGPSSALIRHLLRAELNVHNQ